MGRIYFLPLGQKKTHLYFLSPFNSTWIQSWAWSSFRCQLWGFHWERCCKLTGSLCRTGKGSEEAWHPANFISHKYKTKRSERSFTSFSMLASFALVELYLPAHIGDFFSRADFPPKTETRIFKASFKFPLLFPLLSEITSDKIN